jgi:hypothetical protein
MRVEPQHTGDIRAHITQMLLRLQKATKLQSLYQYLAPGNVKPN